MQKIESDPHRQPEGQWEIYHPEDQDKSIFKVFNKELKNILVLIIGLCLVYLLFTLLSPLTLLVICLSIGAIIKLVKIKAAEIRNKVQPINLVQNLNNYFLKNRSLIFTAIFYISLQFSKIIGAFVRPIISKPHPDQLSHQFEDLPQNIKKAISKKGLLSLVSSKIQGLVVNPQNRRVLPEHYGQSKWQWYNKQKYENHHEKAHEHTIGKSIVAKIDDKITWSGFVLIGTLVSFGVYKMRPNQMKKMLIQNGSFLGIVLVSFIALIKLKMIKDRIKKQKHDQDRILKILNIQLDKDS